MATELCWQGSVLTCSEVELMSCPLVCKNSSGEAANENKVGGRAVTLHGVPAAFAVLPAPFLVSGLLAELSDAQCCGFSAGKLRLCSSGCEACLPRHRYVYRCSGD
jgi:hypothetical protein